MTFWSVLRAACEQVRESYQIWQGTYSAIFLFSLQPAVFGSQYYFITTWILLFGILFSTVRIVCVLLHDCLGKSRALSWSVAAILFLLMIQFMPSKADGLFWFNGAVYYLLFQAGMLCFLADGILFLRDGKNSRLVRMGILGILLGGGNYVTALLTLEFSVFGLVYAAWKEQKRLLPLGIPVLLLAVGLAVNVLAPGNAIRMAEESQGLGIFESIGLSFGASLAAAKQYLHPFMLIGMFCLVPMLVPALRDCRFRFPLPLFVWIGSWLFFASSFAPTFYGLGGDGPYRVQNMRYVLFVLLLALSVGYTVGWLLRVLRERRGEWNNRFHASVTRVEKRFGWVLLIGVMGIGMVLSVLLRHDSAAVTLSAINTLMNGEAKIWHAENLERERILAESGPEVGLPAHSVKPMLLMTKDYSPDPNVEPNTFMAPYYGKEKIWLVE